MSGFLQNVADDSCCNFLLNGLQVFLLRTSVTDNSFQVSMLDHGVSFQIKMSCPCLHLRLFILGVLLHGIPIKAVWTLSCISYPVWALEM
jgi:hypothetical protein